MKAVSLYIFNILLIFLPLGVYGLQCYSCSGSLTSDCANNATGSKGIIVIDDALEYPSCVAYTVKESGVSSAMITRGGLYKLGESPCEVFRKLADIDKCLNCVEDLCNLNLFDKV